MTRFLVDAMCGGVLAHLRMCGHDALFAPDESLDADEDIVAAADAEDRIVVTRDRHFVALADDAIVLHEREPEDQLLELAEAGVALELPAAPTRCGRCNSSLVELGPDEDTPQDAPTPAEQPVWQCERCGQCFWRGSHWDSVAATLADVRAAANTPESE